jgi:hypothetical protein
MKTVSQFVATGVRRSDLKIRDAHHPRDHTRIGHQKERAAEKLRLRNRWFMLAVLFVVRLIMGFSSRALPASFARLRGNLANASLTLSAVGSGDTAAGCRVAKMALAHKRSIVPAAEERRRFQRVRVHLLGRYMLPDRREFPCQIINMSPGGLALLAPGIGNVGDRVIAYLDHIGRVEGKITRIIDNGFAMTVGATARKRDKLAAQLTWLANRDILNLPEDRRHDRIIPRNPIALMTLEDGTKMTCRVIDMSLSGAAIAAENRPPVKSLVLLGKVQSRVVRNLEEGFALEFVHEQLAETLEDSVSAR